MSTIYIRRATLNGWRVLHKIEQGYQKTPPGMPEVLPPDNPLSVDMTEAVQRMSFNLMRYFNPIITAEKWTHAHDAAIAFTNYQGFGMEGDPRRNYIMGRDLNEPLPKYDKAGRICGGTFIRGDAVADKLVCRAGVHGINADDPMLPDVQTIVQNHWYTYAVTVNDDFTKISHFPQGWDGADYYGPVVIPIIFKGTITFPLAYFEKWQGSMLPEPLKVYR